jgi:hypothetical protein
LPYPQFLISGVSCPDPELKSGMSDFTPGVA